MGLFRRKSIDPAAGATVGAAVTDLDELRNELAAVRERLDATDRAKADLESTVESLNQRLIATPPPPAPETPPSAPVVPVADTTDDTARTVEALLHQVAHLEERLAALDGRITSVSTELANQVSELGNDIEPMQAGAERLAAEQARYQIAFRQDLAELAERLRRPGPH